MRDHAALHAFIDAACERRSHGARTTASPSRPTRPRRRPAVTYEAGFGVSWRTSAAGAARACRAGRAGAAVDAVLPRPAAHAHRGDIGLVVIEGRESLVVIEGDLVVGPGLAGLVRARAAA
jgi:hypothetical protein